MNKKQKAHEVPSKFPDEGSCHVKLEDFGDFYQCLSNWVSFCPFSVSFESRKYCTYPSRGEILDGTFEDKSKPAETK